MQQTAASESGIIVFLLVAAFNAYQAYKRGKVEKPLPAPAKPAHRAHQQPVSAPVHLPPKPTVAGPVRKKIHPPTGSALDPVPKVKTGEQPPVLGPVKRPPSIRTPSRESQPPSLQNDPVGLLKNAGNPLYETSIEKVAIEPSASPLSGSQDVDRYFWIRERLKDRTEVQRAIVLNEVLQSPLALR